MPQPFVVEPLPAGATADQVAAWAGRAFEQLQDFFRRPEFGSAVLTLQNSATAPDVEKTESGLIVYAAAGVIGVPEGYYVREGGVWKKITAV